MRVHGLSARPDIIGHTLILNALPLFERGLNPEPAARQNAFREREVAHDINFSSCDLREIEKE